MKKQVIRLTESGLHRIVKESVNSALKEGIGLVSSFSKDGEENGIDTEESFFRIMHSFSYIRDLANEAINALKKTRFV